MTTIQQAYIDALLADAAYVDVNPGMDVAKLTAALRERMTPTLAAYIAANFEVVSSINTSDIPLLGSGFDATVWRIKAGSELAGSNNENAGKTYVFMRGTEPPPVAEGADLLADGDLALGSAATTAIVDMVNWWLREITPTTELAKQIKWDPLYRPNPASIEIVPSFVEDTRVTGTGHLVGVSNVQVDGHSMGGHMASAFARIFGAGNGVTGSVNILDIATFNSAGFNGDNSETLFQEIQALLGTGTSSFASVSAKQTNYFAANGINVTTNTWWFTQMGTRTGLYQEESTGTPNHSMYRLTDLLAVGAALEKLDSSFTIDKLNTLSKIGSNDPKGSIEGVLDSLRRALGGPNVERLPISDAADSDRSRVTFQATLAALQNNPIFKDLSGKLHIELTSSSLASLARSDFGALIALQDLSPLYISGTDAAAQAQLAEIWQAGRTDDYAAWKADKSSATPVNFTDQWIADRTNMLTDVTYRNRYDEGNSFAAVRGRGTIVAGHYVDVATNTDITVGDTLLITQSDYLFGDSAANTLTGHSSTDHLYGGAGDDTLNGMTGNDYLEGGAGTDTYTFSGQFGNDTILDTDGLGAIKIAGDILNGGKWLSQNLWESEDKKYLYTLQDSNLVISLRNAPTAGSITVKNYTAGQLGLALPSTSTDTPTPIATSSFNLSSEAGWQAYRNADTSNSTQDLLIQNAAAAHNIGTAATPQWLSAWARSGSGDDVIEGGATLAVSNTLLATGAGNDRIYAGTTVSLSDAIERGDNPSTVALTSSHYVLDGGAGDDQIIGSDARDVLFGGAGDDTIVGGAGGDIIFGDGNSGGLLDGAGASLTDAQIVDGPATSIGNTAALRIDHTGLLLGSTDSDSTGRRLKFEANPPTQYLNPLYSADYTALQNLNDTDIRGLGYSMDVTSFGGVSYGGELTTAQSVGQHTTYQGTAAVGVLSTNKETGNDVIYAGAGDDVVNAGAGNDIVIAGDGNDNVAGYEGDDYITGGAGNDVLLGDSFVMGAGADYSSTPNMDLYSAKLLVNGYSIDTSQHGRDMIDGGSGDDQIEGDGKDDLLFGGEGNDLIFGDDSAALIQGDAAGNDVVDGGSGDDMLFGGAGQDWMDGGDDNDILVGDWQQDDGKGGGADTLMGGAGNDVLYGAAGNDQLFGGAGDDVLRGDATVVAHTNGVEVELDDNAPVSADAGDDDLDGGAGDDALYGNAGKDTLIGGEGNDHLYGGDGNDLLQGGTGADYLNGGAGDDTYVFSLGDSVPEVNGDGLLTTDTIVDTNGKNVIRLQGVALSDMGITKSGVAGSQNLILQYGLTAGSGGQLVGSNLISISGGALNHTVDALEVDGQTIDFETYVGQNMQSVMDSTATQDGQYLLGGARNDTLSLTKNNGLVVAGRGQDSITLAGTGNVVKLSRGDGNDTVSASAATSEGSGNAILWGTGIAASDLQVSTVGNGAVRVQVTNGNASVTISGGGVDELRFVDGAPTLQLADKVQAYLNTQATTGSDWIEGSLFSDVISAGTGDDVLMGYGGNDTLMGGAGTDFLYGGDGNNTLDGGDGQDNLIGGDGNDTLVSDGSDYLDGGAGDDTYHITLSGMGSSALGVVNDGQGHDTLTVANGPQDLNDYAVFSQDGVVYLAAGRVGTIALGSEINFDQFSVTTLAGDTRSLSALIAQHNAQGDVQSGTWSAETGVQWSGSATSAQVLVGSDAADALSGGASDDVLLGRGGDDQLTGGGGQDVLEGGSGTNTYLFAVGDGKDSINPTAGEHGILRFEGGTADAFSTTIVGDDLLIVMGANDQVRIQGYGKDNQLATDWSVVLNGQTTTLAAFVATTQMAATLDARKNNFIAEQYAQLRTQPQYLSNSPWGYWAGWGSNVAPTAVTQKELQVVEGVPLGYESYLHRVEKQRWVKTTQLKPIYEQTAGAGSGVRYVFVPVEERPIPGPFSVYGWVTPYSGFPPTFVSFQNPWGLIGYMTIDTTSVGPRIIGWQQYVHTETVTSYTDTATQMTVHGTDTDDVIQSSSSEQFRGIIETGDGNDSINLRTSSWETAVLSMNSAAQNVFAAHGMGAWIDVGNGNDRVQGTDGSDFIIGGAGSDVLDGNVGADTYLISASTSDVDHIQDMEVFESVYIEAYGGQINQDIVEFDNTITLSDLSYRWNTHTGNSNIKILELFRKDQLFLQIDYDQNPGFQVGSGIEQFKFSDGSSLSLDALLGVLPHSVLPDPYGNPYGDPYGDPYGNAAGSTFELDAGVLLSSLTYQWIASDLPGVVTLALFQDGQALMDFDFDSSVANTAQVRSLGGVAKFALATGEVLALQDFLGEIRLEPALPQLDSPLPDLVATEDSPLVLTLPADAFSDPQNRVLHFSASLENGDALPSWLHFDINTREFTGAPGNDQVGALQIRVTAINDAGLATSDVFALSVLNTNDVPVASVLLPDQDIVPDAVWRYQVPANSFVDVDAGDTLTYSAILTDGSALPIWLTFDSATRTFSGTPGTANVGSLSLTVIATDVAGASASLSLTLTTAGSPSNTPLSGNDALTADTNNTPLHGGAGDDTLNGSWASSSLFGDSGNDVLTASGGPSNVLDGGDGDDTLTGGWGTDTLLGGEGNNTILANGGNSTISAGVGNDLITSSWGDDIISAGDGTNIVSAGGGNNVVTTGSGADIITTEWGNDTITSGAGNDTISSGWGADVINAGAGDDIIHAGGGGDTVRGGLGNDTVINDQWSDDRYLFARGDGQDVMLDGGGQDRLTLENVSSDQLWFSQNGNDLELSVIGTQDHITLQNWYLGNQYPGSQYHIEQFKTSDGKTLLDSQVQNLVSAMAGFAPPAAGETTLSASYSASLNPVIAANWQ